MYGTLFLIFFSFSIKKKTGKQGRNPLFTRKNSSKELFSDRFRIRNRNKEKKEKSVRRGRGKKEEKRGKRKKDRERGKGKRENETQGILRGTRGTF
ncbi:hypothetical protein [Enterocloster sp.]|uniref:hypothetical protein n=1 Tax=Enterocloster sp. TaxID=2719315 RepID=UPI00399514CC